jgi:CubicO group peptidase (beta-lactamase class C family)
MTRLALALSLLFLATAPARAASAGHGFDGRALASERVDAIAKATMAKGRIPGLALAIVDDGQVAFVGAYGHRDVEKGLPLQTDTVMYAASLTKAAFGYMVAQLADEGVIDLDAPIARYLKKPLPDYSAYAALAGDERWRKLTPRILLGHASGFANFVWLEPDEKLRFHFDPGTRYGYSGDGINLLQFVLEEGLGLDVGAEMQRRVFDRFGMARSSMTWRSDFAGNLTTGYDAAGKAEPHDARESVRAAGSLDTTVSDYAKFLAGFTRGDGLSAKGRADILRPVVAITSAHQFPTLDQTTDPANARIGLASALGWVRFEGRYGLALQKAGHNDQTDNLAICVKRRCLLMMTNSGVGARLFPTLTAQIMGDPGAPWAWEYNPLPPLEP